MFWFEYYRNPHPWGKTAAEPDGARVYRALASLSPTPRTRQVYVPPSPRCTFRGVQVDVQVQVGVHSRARTVRRRWGIASSLPCHQGRRDRRLVSLPARRSGEAAWVGGRETRALDLRPSSAGGTMRNIAEQAVEVLSARRPDV
jgi:hypothetical protein